MRTEISYKRALIQLLDRPGGRWLLGKIATPYVRRLLRSDVEIAHIDHLWTHRVGPNFFPDGANFDYVYADYCGWKGQLERYAEDTTQYWLKHYRPRKGDVIIDVGAGRGEDIWTFSRAVGQAGRVIAIECHPLSFAILKNFCRLNGLTNVTALQLALMDKPGVVRLIESESSWLENSIEYGNISSGIEVRAVTLDQICSEQAIKDIAFLKMNIEGAERYALLGMESTLSCTRQVCVACHDFRCEAGDGEQYRTRAFVAQFLVNKGFCTMSNPHEPRSYVRDHVFGLRCD